MKISTLGTLSLHSDIDEWLISEPVLLPILDGLSVRFVVDAEAAEHAPQFGEAVKRLTQLGDALLDQAQPHVLQYYREFVALLEENERPAMLVDSPRDIWKYVQWGSEWHIHQRENGDKEDGTYISVECNCDWEPEHGLQIVIREGSRVSKIGPFDGHLTNADAYANPKLVGVIFKSFHRD